jgi:GLTT repeat (6 copies)
MREIRVQCKATLAAIAAFAVACGSGAANDAAFDARNQELISKNGMSSNGLSVNGLSSNGMSSNGLSSNGLSSNGLSSNGLSSNGLASAAFGTWWNSQDPAFADMVMTYVAKCAMPSNKSLTFTDPAGVVHTWAGNLGLAPTWASGKPIPTGEQQIMTSCLAAHSNAYGVHVDISVLGFDASGHSLPIAQGELTTFPFDEAAFFGNLFTGEGIYACADTLLTSAQSSIRGCALNASTPNSTFCPQITYVGKCSTSCSKSSTKNPYWDTCKTPGSVTYPPLTTHIANTDIATCGDGVCAISEVPGTGKTWDNCADCPLQ